MCDFYNIGNKYCNNFVLIFNMILFLILSIVQFVFYFYMKQTDFGNIFDTFESSPLFDFSVETNCGSKSHITFHVWEGRKETSYYYYDGTIRSETKIVDVTNIDKINGQFFCYKHISYKDLLYNNQIKRECTGIYSKNCGIIDTLNQNLCIKEDEDCPLYDVGIGTDESNPGFIYYSHDENDPNNKKIIGKVILNDGQPCYRLNEKLWKKFVSDEAGDEHLKCELEIFGKFTDDRFKPKGVISYNQLYYDNLGDNYNELFKDIKSKLTNNKVSLYSREFLGIDKECDEKNEISKDDYEILSKNQKLEKIFSIIESIMFLIFVITLSIIIIIIFRIYKGIDSLRITLFSFLIIGLVIIFIFIICHSVFFGRIIHNDLSYNCSDEKTNEILKKENENAKKFILLTAINLGLNIFTFLINILIMLIIYLLEKYCFSNVSDNGNKIGPPIIEKDFKPGEKDFNLNNTNEVPVREVVVNNGTPIQENQSYNNQKHNENLDIPPSNIEEINSGTRI